MKGEYGAGCNRTACGAPGATFYNQSTRKFYCGRCAVVLNAANATDAFRLFGSELCVPISHDAHPRHGAMRDEGKSSHVATRCFACSHQLLAYIAALEADRARLDWLQMHCCGVELRDSAGTERTFEREYFSDDSFRDFLDRLPAEYEHTTLDPHPTPGSAR